MVKGQVALEAKVCLLYTSDAADDMQCVDLGGRRIIKKDWDLCWKTTLTSNATCPFTIDP